MARSRTRRARISQDDYEALADFRYTLRQFLAFSEAAARSIGLTPRQHQALLAIKGAASATPPTIGDLAERLGLRHHSAVGLVDRLVGLSLVRRVARDKDRRRVRLLLSLHGRRVLEQLSGAHRTELKQVAPRLRSLLRTLEAGHPGRARRRAAARR